MMASLTRCRNGPTSIPIVNRRKSLRGKGLGRRGGGRIVVSPYATTGYVKRFPKVFLAILPIYIIMGA
jgi:hypothetical protein